MRKGAGGLEPIVIVPICDVAILHVRGQVTTVSGCSDSQRVGDLLKADSLVGHRGVGGKEPKRPGCNEDLADRIMPRLREVGAPLIVLCSKFDLELPLCVQEVSADLPALKREVVGDPNERIGNTVESYDLFINIPNVRGLELRVRIAEDDEILISLIRITRNRYPFKPRGDIGDADRRLAE